MTFRLLVMSYSLSVRRLCVAFPLVIFFAAPAFSKGETRETYWGIATKEDGQVAYTEKHTVTKRAGRLLNSKTVYYTKDRRTKVATMVSDYSRSLTLPTYEFVDLKSGYREGLRFRNGRYVVFNQKKGETESNKVLKDQKSVFSCQGWHYYLVENLKTLEKEGIALNLVLPSELDYYSFEIEKANSRGDKIETNLKLSNWLLSFFAPELRLVYDKKRRRLIEYEGISNILDEEGNRQTVKITYQYEAAAKAPY